MSLHGWSPSMVKGCYISDDNRYTAELRPAGYYADAGCKLTRHYAIRAYMHTNIIGTAATLKKAQEMYL